MKIMLQTSMDDVLLLGLQLLDAMLMGERILSEFSIVLIR